MTRILFAALIFATLTFPLSVKAENTVTYTDELDPMTDERILQVIMIYDGGGKLGSHAVSFRCFKGKPAMAATSGLYLNIGTKIPVSYRFDKEQSQTEQFIWSGGQSTAIKFEAQDILDKTLTSNKFLVKISDRALMEFNLVEAHEKLQNLDKECKTWDKKSVPE
tara:strand:- start:1679 stop:2173 length:495 start_codon:yes stop_codon:yes gene_type:complete